MKYTRLVLILAFACATIGIPNITQVFGQTSRPPEYYEDKGACPFECCTYREWTVLRSTTLYADRTGKSPAVFTVRRGDRVIGLTGIVITVKTGSAMVKKEMTLGDEKKSVHVKPGDVLYLIHYLGEGYHKFWFRGKIYEAEMPFAPDLVESPGDARKNDELIHQISGPVTVWWVKVKNRRGQIGWTIHDENFGNMDACG